MPPLEIWAGIECSVIRVGDRVVDELALTGTARRGRDVDRLAALGVTALRFPALWERQPDPMRGRFAWGPLERRLDTVRSAGIRPILGLFHGGTGRAGELLDPAFPDAFARYASAIAERFPWVDTYLPINEPLTTARFAGLYGHWHPHARDAATFGALVVAQARAHRAAVSAIRGVRPDVQVVMTEDIGWTASTRALRSQAEFDRERRWLMLDLAFGRVADEGHPLWRWLTVRAGVPAPVLADLAERPSPPDLLGVHHYPPSDRFLDERMERYPAWSHGGNAERRYADVELIRVLGDERNGLREAVLETSERYAAPIAMTEVHIGGTRTDQLAWWWSAVRAADELRARGHDVRAVTAWAAFGSFDWPSLLTRADGWYEPGLFDARVRPPRPTLLARAVAAAAAGRRPRRVAPGWWQREGRVLYPPVNLDGRDIGRAAQRAA